MEAGFEIPLVGFKIIRESYLSLAEAKELVTQGVSYQDAGGQQKASGEEVLGILKKYFPDFAKGLVKPIEIEAAAEQYLKDRWE
jgi:hypothetical protein